MNSLLQFFRSFLQNKGQYVFLSLLIGKICAFVTSLIIVRLLSSEEFGRVSVVSSIFAVFVSVSGFGSYQSLLRFGSVAETETAKKALSGQLFRQGFAYQIVLTLLFLFISLFFIKKFDDILQIFIFFSVRLLGTYFQTHIQTYLRITGNNLAFSRCTNFVNIAGLLLIALGADFFGLYGYLAALAISPFFSLLWFKSETIAQFRQEVFNSKDLWSFAFHTAFTSLVTEALLAADVVILGFLTSENIVADYKVALMIPVNFTFMAAVFLQTDFPKLAKNFKDRIFLRDYIINYYKIFIPVSILVFTFVMLFGKDILTLFFTEKYAESSFIFILFTATFLLNIMLRNLYGNLFSAVGKMRINTLVSVWSLVFLIGFGFLLVPYYGAKGMAIALSLTMVFSGLLLIFYFYRYLRSLP